MRASLRPDRVASQLLNSASSAVFSLGIVAATSDAQLGSIAIQMTALPVVLGLARTAVYESVLFKVDTDQRQHVAWVPALTGAVAGVVAAFLTLAIGVLIEGELTATTAAISIASFGVVAFDGLRFCAFAIDRDRVAAVGDSIWLAGMMAFALFWSLRGDLGPTQVAWSYAATAAFGALAFFPVVVGLKLGELPSELRSDVRFGWDFVLQAIPGQLALIVGSLVSGLTAVGIIRAAVTLFSPLATVVYAARIVLIDRSNRGPLRGIEVPYALISVAYGILLVGAFAGLPGITERPFGRLPLAVLALVGVGETLRHVMQATIDRDRLVGAFRRIMSVRSMQAVLLVGLSAALGALADENGLAWARVLAFGLPLLLVYSVRFRLQRARALDSRL
jgi:hypothetical protein